MKNIWKVYQRDVKRILTNPVALIIIIGLCLLPSLYAWFNIYASWDPYGNTNGVKVAVVNNDKGGTLREEEINIGNDIVDELKNNTDIGWIFVDNKEAEYGLTHNKYYASIEIPENFSEDISTITSNNPIKPQLIYKVNEKSNAIAPKITSAGAKALLKNVTSTFVDKVNKVVFESLNSVGEEIDTNKEKILTFRDLVYRLNDSFEEINSTLNKAEDGVVTLSEFTSTVNTNIPLIEESITEAKDVSASIRTLVGSATSDFNESVELVKVRLVEVRQLMDEFNIILDEYISGRGDSSQLAPVINQLSDKADKIDTRVTSVIEFLKGINVENNLLSSVISDLENIKQKVGEVKTRLGEISATLEAGHELNSQALTKLQETSKSLGATIDSKVENFDNNIKPAIDSITSRITAISNKVDTVLNEAEGQMPKIKKLLDLSNEGTSVGMNYITDFKEKLPSIEESVGNLTNKLKSVASDDNVNEIINILINNSDVMGDYISSPVELVEESIYHIPNYGSAMSPFYSVLSIWVGVLLLSSIVSTEVDPLEDGELGLIEQYFGRMLLFLTVAIIQSAIIAIGDKYVLGVFMENIGLFIGFSIFTSIIFTLIVYTLVSLLGNVGKAVGIILLVLQVAGSGGTFPIEVTPQFFQNLQPFLPFTYAIGSLREAVGGPLWTNVLRDTKVLLIYGVVALLVGVLLKKFLHGPMEKVQHKFKESGLSE